MSKPIVAPSGAVYDFTDQTLVWELGGIGTIEWSDTPFRLKSGILSHVYVHGREELTDNPQTLKHVGQAIAKRVRADLERGDSRMPCLIGVPMAANALAQAAAFMSSDTMCFRVMRPVKKAHGTNQTWVDGTPNAARHQYIGIEGVTTSGASLLEAVARLEEDGYPARQMQYYTLVDRGQGAMKRLADEGLKVKAIFNLTDLAFVLCTLNKWSAEQYQAVVDEIAAHQL